MYNLGYIMIKTAVFVAAFAAAVSAQTEPWCRCAAFTTYEHTEAMVWEGPEITISSCEDTTNECKDSCTEQLNTGSNQGDLWYITPSGITVGQTICDSLIGLHHHSVHNHRVYGYFELCGGAWQYTGVASQQLLCCEGGKHQHCVT